MSTLPPVAPMLSEQAAWLAGLLDGEGCFDSPHGNPRLRVKMTDFDVVLRASGLMGGTSHIEHDRRLTVIGEPRSSTMVAQVTGPAAVSVMRAVLPWLGSRRSAKVTAIIVADARRAAAKKAKKKAA